MRNKDRTAFIEAAERFYDLVAQQIGNKILGDLADYGEAIMKMPPTSTDPAVAWKDSASYYGSFTIRSVFTHTTVEPEQVAEALRAVGEDPDQALGKKGYKRWNKQKER